MKGRASKIWFLFTCPFLPEALFYLSVWYLYSEFLKIPTCPYRLWDNLSNTDNYFCHPWTCQEIINQKRAVLDWHEGQQPVRKFSEKGSFWLDVKGSNPSQQLSEKGSSWLDVKGSDLSRNYKSEKGSSWLDVKGSDLSWNYQKKAVLGWTWRAATFHEIIRKGQFLVGHEGQQPVTKLSRCPERPISWTRTFKYST